MRLIKLLILFSLFSAPSCISQTPDTFKVLFTTTKGNFIVEAYRSWSPLGVNRFYELVQQSFYTNIYIFRVERDYVVQFGIADDPQLNRNWERKTLPDEPVKAKHTKGIVAFARSGKHSRSTQLFVNVVDNPKLDTTMREGVHGYSPIGKVIEGMKIFMQLNAQYAKKILPLQDSIYLYGNSYLDKNFPGLDKILSAKIIR